MAVHYLDALADDDIAEDGEEREDGWKGRLAVDDEEGHVVDFKAVGKVAHTCTAGVGMRNHNHLVAPIDEFLVLFSAGWGCFGGGEALHWTAGTYDSPLLLLFSAHVGDSFV